MESTPAPHFLGRNAVCEPAEALRAKVSLVLPSRPDWNGVAADFGAIFFKKSGGAKTAFIAFRGQVVFLGQA